MSELPHTVRSPHECALVMANASKSDQLVHISMPSKRQTETFQSGLAKLQSDNSLNTENQTFSDDINLLHGANTALRSEIEDLTESHDDILPFVRDQYAAAPRTLVDGVRYAAGWTGTKRAEFMQANGHNLEALFRNRFTSQEITDFVK
jgi:hypothetical protein